LVLVSIRLGNTNGNADQPGASRTAFLKGMPLALRNYEDIVGSIL